MVRSAEKGNRQKEEERIQKGCCKREGWKGMLKEKADRDKDGEMKKKKGY